VEERMNQVQVRGALVEALRADLVGPMTSGEVIEIRPSRWYLTGFLVPSDTPLEERRDPGVSEGVSIDADTGDEPQDDVQAHQAYLPSSMGLTFFAAPQTRQVKVTARWAEYQQIDAEETRRYQDLERERRGLEPKPPAEDAEEGDAPRVRYWRHLLDRAPSVTVSLDSGRDDVPLTPERDVYIKVVVRPAPVSEGPSGTRVVSIFLVNGRPHQTRAADERTLFQTALEVSCPEGFQPRYRRGSSDHPDDRRNDLQFRRLPVWAVGHGVSTEVLDGDSQQCRRLGTTWLPTARVYRMAATAVEGVTLSMRTLSEVESAERLEGMMAQLMVAYMDWISSQVAEREALSDPTRRRTADELVTEARLALSRIRAGVALLGSDADAFRAFRLTNRAMAETAELQRPGTEARWRLFQLAFLLLNLSGVSHPDHADRQRVELLFFPTGGGKTEAYLGVAAYTLFMRRLRHQDAPHRGAGVGVLLRYTLRLLTLDQLQRAAQLVCAMEIIRREEPDELGPHRFSVGVWVGRKATANYLADLKPVIRKLKSNKPLFGEPAPVPLTSCPWCGTPFDKEAFTLLPERAKVPVALQVSCDDDECPFNAAEDDDNGEYRKGLPIVTVDEHVYRELPSILIGTVDKFAALPWRGASGNLLGRVRAEDSTGFYGANEKPPASATPLPGGLLPPDLIIQDELHLISGPLGTMVGLYETAIDALCRDKVPQGPKIIASTATARRATEQIQAIFAREWVHLFPPQGLEDGDTFFAEVDAREETTRLYVGIASPGRAQKLLTSRVFTCLLGAAQKRWEDTGKGGAGNPADTYMTLVAYFNALKELGGAQRIVLEEVNGRTRQLSRRRPLDEERSAHFADRHLSFDILELTSRQSTDDITKASALLRKPYTSKGRTKTDVLLASSMISVGVDISRLGLMVVNGQPRTCAEYIQASSRVGRASPGLVVTAFNLFKPRDRSHYEQFQSFHESFYRYVEAASVTPFSARAVDRGLAGLVVSLSRHLPPRMAPPRMAEQIGEVPSLEAQISELLVARAAQHRPDFPEAMKARLRERVRQLLEAWTELITAVRDDGQYLVYSPWEKAKGSTSLLSSAVDDLRGEHAELLDHFRAPTSMRDVEPSVHIWVDQKRISGV